MPLLPALIGLDVLAHCRVILEADLVTGDEYLPIPSTRSWLFFY